MEQYIAIIATYVIPFVLGWLIKSPLWKAPASWSSALTDAVGNMKPDDYMALYNKIATKRSRRETAIEEAAKYLQPDLAEQFVDYVTARLKKPTRR